MVALYSRWVTQDVNCPLCHQTPETIQHIFCECSCVAAVWSDFAGFPFANGVNKFTSWMAGLVTNGNTDTVLQVLAKCWCIWRGRNEVVWNSKPWLPMSIKMEASLFYYEWQVLVTSTNNIQSITPPLILQPSCPQGVLKIYVDATVFNDSDVGYFGMVFLDSMEFLLLPKMEVFAA
ncbi:PREDICTED: uncharacterized protein LOC109175047 [Ipomoea nil]|uniref:uncharacterized protein LOC109175047 n=1 Tax=Ipomoea nil TaxID=35883 RepID=UPI000901134E|nr:PREDICTED: uncharacterized protein LOC109175047 [Ipomoea nil]